MSYQKCNSLAKQNLFADKRNTFESRLKQNVIYRRDYTLRPTVKLDQFVDNDFNKSQTMGNNSKNSSNQRTNSSPIKAKQTFVSTSERNSYSSDAIKPVIQVKPKAVNSYETKTEDKFESKAPDIRRRAARSASLPAISMRLKPSTGTDKSGDESPECQQVMNHIRRRFSQIIDSHLLSGDEDRHESSDSQKSNQKFRIKDQRTGRGRHSLTINRRSKTSESGFCDKHLFSSNYKQKQRQGLNDSQRYDSTSDENQRLDSEEESDYTLFLKRHQNKQKSDEKSSEDSNEDRDENEMNLKIRKEKFFENLRNNSYALIHNLNNYHIFDE